ncbi:MAG: hypothetical protein ACK4MV_18120 [Beijerinckiaceae bacterium]
MIGRKLVAAGFSAAALALTPLAASALECDLFKGVYTPINPEDDMSAEAGKQNRYSAHHVRKRLRFNQAQFAFRLTEANRKISYDFGFAFANGYGGTSLVFAGRSDRTANHKMKESDPSSKIMYFDENLRQAQPDWEKGGAAPLYLIMPGIGSSFWYWDLARKFVPPAGMWKLTSCEG